MMATFDPCAWCEEVLQPYLDRHLSETEQAEAQAHLEGCGYCAKRYRLEAALRQVVRKAGVEEMEPALKQKLASLRTPLF
jgi:anti-sigma factor (TIGR02949 family)